MDNVSAELVSYARQNALDERIENSIPAYQTHTYVIIGCGGVGFWAALMLAMMGVQRFILIDEDDVETTNLNRLPVPQTWVGTAKVVALRRLIRTLRPLTSINCLNLRLTPEDMPMLKDQLEALNREVGVSIIDTTDDGRIQKTIYGTLKQMIEDRVIRYVKLGYEGFKVGAYPNFDVWLPDNYTPGYRTTEANSVTSAVAAGIGIFKLLLGNTEDMNIDLIKLTGKSERLMSYEDPEPEPDEDNDNEFEEHEEDVDAADELPTEEIPVRRPTRWTVTEEAIPAQPTGGTADVTT